jgi:hypothetical protein
VEQAIAGLQRAGKAPNLNVLLLDLERRLSQRRALEDALNALPRTAYSFGALRADLARRFKAPKAVLDSRGAIGRAHGEVIREVTAAIRAAGRDLVAAGAAEQEALEQLSANPDRWVAIARPVAQRIAERLSGAEGRSPES